MKTAKQWKERASKDRANRQEIILNQINKLNEIDKIEKAIYHLEKGEKFKCSLIWEELKHIEKEANYYRDELERIENFCNN